VLCGSSIPPEFTVLITNNQNGTTMYSKEMSPDQKSGKDGEDEDEEESPAPPLKQEVTPQQAKKIINQELKERALAAKERWIAAPVQAKQRAKAAMAPPKAGGDSLLPKVEPPEVPSGSTKDETKDETEDETKVEPEEPEADYGANEADDRQPDEDVVLSSAILAETTVNCEKCQAQNAKGLLTCNLCGFKLKVSHIPADIVEVQIQKATAATFQALHLTWRITTTRGGYSDSGKKRKAARKMLQRLTKAKIVDADGLPYHDLLDRFMRDIEWQTEKMREGHDEESIQAIQFLGESNPKTGHNMSWADRQKFAGKNKVVSSGTGSSTRPIGRHDHYTETVAGARQWNEAQYAAHNQSRRDWQERQYQQYVPNAGGDSSHSGHSVTATQMLEAAGRAGHNFELDTTNNQLTINHG
jgi:hypothetical protein